MTSKGYAPLDDAPSIEMSARADAEVVFAARVTPPPSGGPGGPGGSGAGGEQAPISLPLPPPPKGTDSDDDDDESDIEVFPPQPVPGVHLATMEQKKALWWKSVLITTMFILTWYLFATLLSMYNKWMFSPEYYGFSYPLFVTACHMVVQFSCAAVIRYTVPKYRPAERPTRRDYGTRILPTAWATGSDIGLSNLSLKTITLSLYTMCKSSALIFVLMFAFLFRLEKFSVRLISVILLITIGVFMMVFNVTEASIPGIIMVLSASAIGGLRWALTELIMQKKSMGLSNPFATIFWLAPPMGIILLLVSMLIEDWKQMFTSVYFSGPLVTLKSIGIIVLPGVLAFAMVASEYFVIMRAGVVPLSIAGIAKEVSTIGVSAWFFKDKLTTLNLVGCAVTILGIALYSFHKYRKSMRKTVRLDASDNPIDEDDERAPLAGPRRQHQHHRTLSTASAASMQSRGSQRSPAPTRTSRTSGTSRTSRESHRGSPSVPLQNLDEVHADRVDRLRDEFEGWDDVNVDSGSEAGDDEVARRRADRIGGSGFRRRWDNFWDKPV